MTAGSDAAHSQFLELIRALWKALKCFGVFCAVIVSIACLAYLSYGKDTQQREKETTTAGLPEFSQSTISVGTSMFVETSTLASSSSRSSTSLATTTSSKCLTYDCSLDCCSIELGSCLVRCQGCSRFSSQVVFYLAATSNCPDIHLVLSNCSVDLQHNWLDIPINVRSLSILTRLDSLGTSAFTAEVFRHTESLLLADVTISELHSYQFYGLANLRQLKLINIQNLRVNSITEHLFASLVNLSVLEVTEITGEMPLQQLIGLYGHVETLTLNDNQITYIYPGVLSRLQNLVEFNAKNAKVRVIYTDAFANLPNLRRVNLAHNNIANFPSDLFAELVLRPGAQIDISFQPWLICNCLLLEIKEYLQSAHTKDVFRNSENLICVDALTLQPSVVKSGDVCDWGPLQNDYSSCLYCLQGNKLEIQ